MNLWKDLRLTHHPYRGWVFTFETIFFLLFLLTFRCEAFIAPGKSTIQKYGSNDSSVVHQGNTFVREESKYLWSSEGSASIPSDSSFDGSQQVPLAESAASLSTFLQGFVNLELGVNETRKFFESTSFDVRRGQSLENQAKTLAENFSIQIESYLESAERLVEAVKFLSMYNESLPLEKCCDLKPESFIYDSQYNMEIRRDIACWSAVSKSKNNLFVPSVFNQVMLKNLLKLPYLKWQYFVSPEGVYVEYPANNHNCKNTVDEPRSILSPKTHPERKMWLIQKSKGDSRIHRIVFLIQLGRNPTAEMLKSMKNIVLMLLRFLDEADEVGILNVDPDEVWSDFLCDQLVPVTPWTRYQVLSYLNYIEHRYRTSSQHSLQDFKAGSDPISALNKSVRMACANFSSSSTFPPSAATIIHLASDLDLNKTTSRLTSPCPIFIESYFLASLVEDEEMLYKANIQKAALKNIWNIQVHSMTQMEPESFAIKVALKLNSKKEWWSLSDILSQFFPEEKEKSLSATEFSLPHWNPLTKESVIVAKKYVFLNSQPLGLVAVEIPIVHFTQHINYFVNENVCDAKNYAFLIDMKGRVIAHPALGKPDTSQDVLSPIQIEQVEVYQGFSVLQKKLLSADETTGCHSLRLRTENDWVTYAWSKVHGYVVVIVAFGNSGSCVPDREDIILRKSFLNPKTDIQHHSLLQKTHCCSNQGFSTSKAALYLSPSAFSKPANAIHSYLALKPNMKFSLGLMLALSDNSGMLQNQNKGLKPAVKDHIGVLTNVISMWKERFRKSTWTKYIHRRFSTGGGGTFLLAYPGISIPQSYVPHSSTWFQKAVAGNGGLVFNTPLVNSRGTPTSSFGVLVKSKGPSEVGVPVAVLGATVSIGFFQKVLEEKVWECQNLTSKLKQSDTSALIRCFFVDEMGYVLYHPNLAKTLQTSTLVHITQLEPLLVIDILQYGPNATDVPMRKRTCHKLSDTSATQESLQRFYTLSMTAKVIQKLKHGETCNRYQLLPVPKTNLFLGVVQDNCSSAAAFCPCSTIDNLCLNCLRIEPSDCECPCECPRLPNFCSKHNGFTDITETVEPCEFPLDPLSLDGSPCVNETSCHEVWTFCDNITEKENCIGVHDCEWCENRNVVTPRCTTFEQCYGLLQGRLETKTWSGLSDGTPPPDTSVLLERKRENESQITVVPILGVLAVFLFFLGLMVYCYRHRALRSSTSQPDVHLLPLQESPMGSIVPQAGSSRSNSDTEGEMPVPVMCIRRHRRGNDHPIPLPPRSPLGSVFTESDHGYSTMTHNDDSEVGAPVPLLHLDPPSVPRLIDLASLIDPQRAFLSDATSYVQNLSVPLSIEEMIH